MNGLSKKQVEESREKYGSNVIPESEPTTFWEEFKETFSDPMIKILLVIAAIMIGMFFFGYAEIYEPLGTIVAVFIVAFVTAKTGVASDTSYRNLKASIKKDEIKTYRDGQIHQIVIDDLVVGDYILIQSGDKIPADGILISGNIKVNNAALNGEPEDCKKTPTDEKDDIPENITGDTFVDEHSLFRGAVVTDGEGVMLIKKVGLKTMMGKMAEEMQEDEPDSPLRVKLSKLANQISTFGYIGAVVIALCMMAFKIFNAGGFNAYLSIGGQNIFMDVIDAVSLAIVIIVCAVPEGLPLMISLVLMQNTSKMLDHNVLVRKAIGIETAGSLNILYSDKTGTITKGELEVVEFFTPDGVVHDIEEFKSNSEIYNAIALNTQSVFDDEHRVVGGNITDKALLKFIGEGVYNKITKSGHKVGDTQGFNSANKFSQVYIEDLKKTYYKGAPEILSKKAVKMLNKDGKLVKFDEKLFNKHIDELAEKAMRVLAFGYSERAMTKDSINDDFVITGLVGIRDDVRQDAKEAIKKIQEAGVQLVMITGDRLETARAIARDAGLIKNEEKDLVLTSAKLNEMSDEEVKKIIPNIRVIARALPTDKSRMVRLSQELNLVVGMTGDGVNDSPALKLADVGFAMGKSGTDAAKEASKIIITDDRLVSIADAIWYGRTIYHNILKFCNFQLVINVCAVIVSAIAPFFGVEEPLKVTHLLFVNLVMDSLGAIMLGNEPALEKYMHEKPRQRDESIISKAMATKILWEGFYLTILSFVYLKSPFIVDAFTSEEQHITGYFVLFIVSALFNGFNVRDDRFGIFKGFDENTGFLKVVCVIALIQVLIVYAGAIPGLAFLGKMFSCTPLNPMQYMFVVILGATMIPVDCIRKLLLTKES